MSVFGLSPTINTWSAGRPRAAQAAAKASGGGLGADSSSETHTTVRESFVVS